MVHEDEDERTLKVGSRGKSWNVPFAEPFDLLCCRFRRTGRGIQRTEKTLRKGIGSWWRDGYIHRAMSVFFLSVKEWLVMSSALHWVGVSSGSGE